MSSRQAILFGSLFGFLAVGFGAFAAHALADYLTTSELKTFQTGVQYQMFHAVALLLIGVLLLLITDSPRQKRIGQAGICIVIGIVLFSGSLYVLVLSGINGFGAITPLGGVAFLIGWVQLFWSFLKK